MNSRARSAFERLRPGLWLGVLLGLNSAVTAQDIGFAGPSLAGVGPTVGIPEPTLSKPESKLWFNDRSWWGSIWNSTALAFRIHRLDAATHAWVDTGTEIDPRPDSHTDVLWDGTKLYVASHEHSHGPGGDLNEPQLILRYSYALGNYTLDPGFPVTIGDSATETMVIEKDSKGTLWVVWKQNLRVYYSYTLGSDEVWSAPAVLPACTTDFDSDDICSIVRFNGDRIGVLWSDKIRRQFLFARHFDGAPGTSWTPAEVVLSEWDDHLDLASDSAGRVFAVIKNSAEQVKLLVRGVGGVGGWQQYLVGDRASALTRPIVVLDEIDRKVRVFATSAGAIQEMVSSMDTIDFVLGSGTVVIKDADLPVNNVTSAKRNVTPSTGLVVLASNSTTAGSYWHHEFRVPRESGLVLQPIVPGEAGKSNDFIVTGGTPGKTVAIFASARVGYTTIPLQQCPQGLTLELSSNYVRLPLMSVNQAGMARVRLPIPSNLAGVNIHFQAGEAFSCRTSNRVSERF